MSGQISRLFLRSATLADGRVADVVVIDGRISAVVDSPREAAPEAVPGTSVLDLSGYMLLPAPAEPHAHLDKALTGDRAPNVTGDLAGAIEAIHLVYASMTPSDVSARGLAAVAEAVTHGCTAVRTHVDCGPGIGAGSIGALVELRERLRGVVDLQIVALAGDLDGSDSASGRRHLVAAMEAGADLVGGCPALEPDPRRGVRELLAVARDFGRGVDLHMDETTDAGVLFLRDLAEVVVRTGLDVPVTASHCVSLGMQDEAVARDVARAVADAGIGVVALPQTNLFLQGRESVTRKPRGLTAIDVLTQAGVTVAGGSDNWRDPFNPMGRIDAMETASLLVAAGHLLPADAYLGVSARARAVMGLPPVDVAPGSPAELLAIRAASLTEAIAQASQDRVVIAAGRVVARTTVATERDPALDG